MGLGSYCSQLDHRKEEPDVNREKATKGKRQKGMAYYGFRYVCLVTIVEIHMLYPLYPLLFGTFQHF